MSFVGTTDDELKLHRLCHEGNVRKVREYVSSLDRKFLKDRLCVKAGFFCYTPLQEAINNGKTSVADLILRKAEELNVSIVDLKGLSGYTALHIAVNQGNMECMSVLLQHNANISIEDDYSKTPMQMAQLGRNSRAITLLRASALLREVEMDGPGVAEMLKTNTCDIPEATFSKCLILSTLNNNDTNIGKLVLKGAKNFEECLEISTRERKTKARVMILMLLAARSGDITIIQKLFGETIEEREDSKWLFLDDSFKEVQEMVQSGRVSTAIPIEIARRYGNPHVRTELLLRTDVNQDEHYVYWHGVRLLKIEPCWLEKITWVKRLRLARNGLKSLPEGIGNQLKQLVKLDLQHNNLSVIPVSILQHPCLIELNLSTNRLSDLPVPPKWPNMKILNMSSNLLGSLPTDTYAPCLRRLSLASNDLHTVPACVSSFHTLQSLDLSNNPIRCLPAEMGRLNQLTELQLQNLEYLEGLPIFARKDTRQCIQYLYNKLINFKEYYGAKVIVLGKPKSGKSSLIRALKSKDFKLSHPASAVTVTEWQYKLGIMKKSFRFQIWNLTGNRWHHYTHQCFFSKNALYLIVFDLSKGELELEEVKLRLNDISSTAPHSVIIVGTHLDEIPVERRPQANALLNQVSKLAESYGISSVAVQPVGLSKTQEHVDELKSLIYTTASNYKDCEGINLIGRKIPASYHTLEKQIRLIQEEIWQGKQEDPVMILDEFKALIQAINCPDILYDNEVMAAASFLNDAGLIVHYPNHCHNLHKFLFLDPHWLSHILCKITNPNNFIKQGIMHVQDIPLLLDEKELPPKYFNQYMTILDVHQIAMPVDDTHILVTPTLPAKCPECLLQSVDVDVHSRTILFTTANIAEPSGFWTHVLLWTMKFIPEVSSALGKRNSLPASRVPSGSTSEPDKSFSSTKLEYWQKGLHYSDSSVTFQVEPPRGLQPGVLITASPNEQGCKIISTLVRCIAYIVKAYYPCLENEDILIADQKVQCPECIRLERQQPFEFVLKDALSEVRKGNLTTACHYLPIREDNHVVVLKEILSILLHQDM